MSLTLPERAVVADPVFDLAAHGDRVALHTPADSVSYSDLAGRAARFAADELGPHRRLVLIEAATGLEPIVGYLAALQHGHVAMLVPDGRADLLAEYVTAYDPDVVLARAPGDGVTWRATSRREGSAHTLHPDLALLMSTSGSTGSPKLVRLSHDNLRSNAESIATFLGITERDRAATTLPLHYCYGLSVLNSHLVRGASLALTDASVVDAGFWPWFAASGATSFAGVPYTFELLERSGFAEAALPALRYVTQAGGRMAPERVRRFAALGRSRGWDLVVMSGATEATARMAYLPPEQALARPEAVGVAVPGGALRIDPHPGCAEPGAGELVYSGPNVMLGYAESPADLRLGRTVRELRTGDLARCRDGIYEIVGRRDRLAKVFGLRLDLDRVEALVPDIRCVAVDDALHLFTTRARVARRLAGPVARACGLPLSAVRVTRLAQLPVTRSGKPDYGALTTHARHAQEMAAGDLARACGAVGADEVVTAEALRDEYAVVLGRPDATVSDSFAGLGGDSLSYVELATRLGARLDRLPRDWPCQSIAELAARPEIGRPVPGGPAGTVDARLAGTASPTGRRRWWVPTDTAAVLRALAIVLVVGTHADLFTVMGGAHLLLVLAGLNLARFQLADLPRRVRLRHGLAAVAAVALPSSLVIGGVALATGQYDLPTALFLNGLLGSDTWTADWVFWFLEAVVWCSLGVLALVAVPAADRWERRTPFGVAACVLAVALAARFALVGVEAGPVERYSLPVVAWCFALGWAAARASSHLQRALVATAAAVGMVGFFGDLRRELLVVAGAALVLWLPTVRIPRSLTPVLSTLAGASLMTYLTHWQVYPHLEVDHPLLATLASLSVGIGAWWLVRPGVRRVAALMREGPGRPGRPSRDSGRSTGSGHSTGRPSPRAISIRCTSEVPSPISRTLASR